MNKSVYFIVQNLMYDHVYAVKCRWYHHLFGDPSLTIDTVKAESKSDAVSEYKNITVRYIDHMKTPSPKRKNNVVNFRR